jgi:hypothetical protein
MNLQTTPSLMPLGKNNRNRKVKGKVKVKVKARSSLLKVKVKAITQYFHHVQKISGIHHLPRKWCLAHEG